MSGSQFVIETMRRTSDEETAECLYDYCNGLHGCHVLCIVILLYGLGLDLEDKIGIGIGLYIVQGWAVTKVAICLPIRNLFVDSMSGRFPEKRSRDNPPTCTTKSADTRACPTPPS